MHGVPFKFYKAPTDFLSLVSIKMIWAGSISSIFFLLLLFLLILRFLRKTSVLYILQRWWFIFENHLHVHQSFKIPLYNEHFQENQLYQKTLTYLNSLPSVEDSDVTNLFSGSKPSEIFLHLDANQTVHDTFLSARISWTKEKSQRDGRNSALVLRLKKKDKRRIFRQYFQHILTVADEIEQKRKEIKLYLNSGSDDTSRWRSVPFTHPASFDTMVMDAELKNKVKSDLEQFLRSKQYYHRLGRVWKRSYLLYGASGTGKSSFIAAMARLLGYDVYDMDMSKVSEDSELKTLLLQTTSRSVIVMEDLDRFMGGGGKSTGVSLSGVLNFMDGIVSCCGEERVMVFTVNEKDQIDQSMMRPGRIDVHIHFPLCDFSTFKVLATSYLGVKDHKLFPQVEEVFQAGARMSPAEIGEIMISNRNSPSRALKTVITALQMNGRDERRGQRLSESGSGRYSGELGHAGGIVCQESAHTMREFRNLYGLLRLGSRRKEESMDSGPIEKEGPRIQA